MAVKIPIYEQQTNAQGLLNISGQPHATGFNVSDAVGKGLENLGNAGVGMTAVLAEKENNDAVARTGKVISDAHIQWSDYLKNAQQNATDGAAGLTTNTLSEFDNWAKQTVSQEQNPKAQKYLDHSLTQLRTTLGTTAINYEARAAVSDRDTKLEDAYQNYARMAQSGSMTYDAAKNSIDTMVANIGYDPVTRADRAKSYRERLSEAFLTGQAERDPAGTKRQLQSVYNGGFDHAVGFTFSQEGGYNAKDANGAAVNMGINQEYNPGVDVKNLTKDQAKQIYKNNYWDAIGGDQLAQQNPALATVAFDTAVIAGPGKAKQMIAQSGGDPAKFMDLREKFLAGLVKSNPEKYGRYQKAWDNRNAALRADANTPMSADTSSAIKNLNIDRVPQFINFAHGEQTRQQAVYQSQITGTEGDHIAMFMNGQTVQQPLTQNDYIKAYGEITGPQRFVNYQQAQQLGADIQNIKTLPSDQQQQFLDQHKPDPSKVGYEQGVKRYDILAQAIDQVNTARNSDPMAYAQSIKVGNVQPLKFNDLKAFGTELSGRVGVAKTMNSQYGTPLQLMTKSEAATLTTGFNKMTTPEKLSYMKAIGSSVTDPASYRAIMQQIAPDSPVTAMAGMILQKQNPVIVKHWRTDDVYQQGDVAGIMLEGEALLNKGREAKSEDGRSKGISMPKEIDFRTAFTDQTGKAFAGDAAGADFAYQAVKAYYAGSAARAGDFSGELNNDRMEQSITAVIGGVTNVNGKGQVVRPWGMDENTFQDAAQKAFTQKMTSLGMDKTPQAKFSLYGLQSAGDSKYLLRAGTNYLTDAQGKPVMLDLLQPIKPYNPAVDGSGKDLGVVPEKANKMLNPKLKTKP
jgi:lysozyme family protein